jgi:hypothetical protein
MHFLYHFSSKGMLMDFTTKGTTQELPEGVKTWRDELGKLPRHGAIMHLFLAIDAEGLDLSPH